MSPTQNEPSTDLIRWTFTADPSRRSDLDTLLDDLGAEVFSQADGRFLVLWDEPEADLDEVVERLWELNGSTFEVTHEAFGRLDLLVYQAEGEPGSEAA